MATLGKSATVRWLEATALQAMTTGHGEQPPHETRFGTTHGTFSNFLLGEDWRYRLKELNLHLNNQTDMPCCCRRGCDSFTRFCGCRFGCCGTWAKRSDIDKQTSRKADA
jgi:hypothetical protein